MLLHRERGGNHANDYDAQKNESAHSPKSQMDCGFKTEVSASAPTLGKRDDLKQGRNEWPPTQNQLGCHPITIPLDTHSTTWFALGAARIAFT
jgi:hypothetical protein